LARRLLTTMQSWTVRYLGGLCVSTNKLLRVSSDLPGIGV
jgi:hypothetical protein